MRSIEIAGRAYRIFVFAGIHEDDRKVECHEIEPDRQVCEIRVTDAGDAYFTLVAGELPVQVVRATLDYLDEMTGR
ncbi:MULTISPECIES: hypothetical protein [unclassified Pseudofrankia]|uniref:hypothetical protein n=1 Tax=unclassified Pseudofrankia TaxID=2994372 RepID=UPI0008DA077B|nr:MULTISPECIES: hypothetical protein [unclassified Pseudofrankia]MDT3446800.1 hypothetical protein [Pseudofrankia sp. BMG5.37]OHV57156.1 hypothetical protein BCD48_43350 [Pseudofrankia sp. BMG5.36]